MEGKERVKEIARMLDGSQMSEITIQHAQKAKSGLKKLPGC